VKRGALLLALTLTVTTAGYVPARAAATTVVYAVPSFTAIGWPDYIAREQGFFAGQGLDVQITLLDGQAIVPALLGGSVDIALGNTTGFILAADRGASIVSVGFGAENSPYHIMAAPGITSFKDLKGKKIGVNSEQIDVYTSIIKQLLKKNGLDPDTDVDLLPAGQNQRVSAITAGAIQAGLFTLPADAELASRGFTSLAYIPDVVPNISTSVIMVRRDWAESHDTVARFLRARGEADRWLNDPANKARAMQILIADTKSTPASALLAYDFYVTKTHAYRPNPCITAASLDTELRILYSDGRLKKLTPKDTPKLMETRWCPK
jgi:ABC-type nitrate/sulfonate/bicarbonate transport system substrate-binding protein